MAEQPMAGDWRRHARTEIAQCRFRIKKLVKDGHLLTAMLKRLPKRSHEEQFLRDVVRKGDIERLDLELQIRGWRRLMRLTRVCSRCRGTGKRDFGPSCVACSGQGAVWTWKRP